jgi:hypothetical protein
MPSISRSISHPSLLPSGIIFVALMKQYVLGDRLYSFQWVGVMWNIVSVFLVGGTAILNEKTQSGSVDDATELSSSSSALMGVMLVMMGALVQAMQFVFEEKVMTMDIPSPPLLLIGMEGLWGTILCLFVVYPLVFYIPGSDHGSFENPFNTYAMFMNSPNIQIAFIIYFFAIFGTCGHRRQMPSGNNVGSHWQVNGSLIFSFPPPLIEAFSRLQLFRGLGHLYAQLGLARHS